MSSTSVTEYLVLSAKANIVASFDTEEKARNFMLDRESKDAKLKLQICKVTTIKEIIL